MEQYGILESHKHGSVVKEQFKGYDPNEDNDVPLKPFLFPQVHGTHDEHGMH